MAIPAVVWTILVPVLRLLMGLLSGPMKSLIETQIRELHSKALSTSNPADDLFTEFLAALLTIDLSGVVAKEVTPETRTADPKLVATVVSVVSDNAFDSVVPEDETPTERSES